MPYSRRSYLRVSTPQSDSGSNDTVPRTPRAKIDLQPASETVAALVIGVVPLPNLDPNLGAEEFHNLLHADARKAIDEVYGVGTAKKNPRLVASVMTLRFEHWFGAWNTCTFEEIQERHSQGVECVADAVRR